MHWTLNLVNGDTTEGIGPTPALPVLLKHTVLGKWLSLGDHTIWMKDYIIQQDIRKGMGFHEAAKGQRK